MPGLFDKPDPAVPTSQVLVNNCTFALGQVEQVVASAATMERYLQFADGLTNDPRLEEAVKCMGDAVQLLIACMEQLKAIVDVPVVFVDDSPTLEIEQSAVDAAFADAQRQMATLHIAGADGEPTMLADDFRVRSQADREASEEAGHRIRAEHMAAKRDRLARRAALEQHDVSACESE